MRVVFAALVASAILFVASSTSSGGKPPATPGAAATIFGFRKAAAETAAETQFLSVPDSRLAEEHLRILTKAPHMAGDFESRAQRHKFL